MGKVKKVLWLFPFLSGIFRDFSEIENIECLFDILVGYVIITVVNLPYLIRASVLDYTISTAVRYRSNSGLARNLGVDKHMKQYIKNFLRYKYLLLELIKKNIKLKYRRSYLGILWTLIEPLLTMMVLTLVFGTFFGNNDEQYPVYILSGRLLYSFFSSASKAGLKSVSSNAGMIKKVYVPKYIYVLSAVISNFVTFLISLVVLVGVGAVLNVQPTVYLVQSVISLLILFVMTLGISMILATLNVFFRDIEYIWSVGTMLIMYASAIFYQTDRVINTGNGWVFNVNPIYMCISNFRNSVLYGCPLNMHYCVTSAVVAVVLLLVGIVLFNKKQDKFILYV